MSRLTAKGEARRTAIVQAAARLVAAEGPDALTHRAVVAASGIPLAATTYYFASIDDLRAAAVGHLVDDERRQARSLVEALPRRPRSAAATARHVVAVLLGADRDDAELLALYERFLACGRHPRLRPLLREARAAIDAALAELLERCGRPATDVATLVALVDGSVVSALVEGDGSGGGGGVVGGGGGGGGGGRRPPEEAVARALG
ncbi:TetR/AcrR family transcriptional regulator [Geodermatophilus sp. SYSU D00766]